MQVKVITLPFEERCQGFDDGPLQAFIRDKQVHAVAQHYFERQGRPYLTFVVEYEPHPAPAPVAPQEKPPRQTWRELVTEAEMPLFNTLRTWRAERAKADGVPPYVICTNRQLAQVVPSAPCIG